MIQLDRGASRLGARTRTRCHGKVTSDARSASAFVPGLNDFCLTHNDRVATHGGPEAAAPLSWNLFSVSVPAPTSAGQAGNACRNVVGTLLIRCGELCVCQGRPLKVCALRSEVFPC